MTDFLGNLEETLPGILALVVIGSFAVVIFWEMVFPRRTPQASQNYRWINNIALTILNHLVLRWVTIGLTLIVSWWSFSQEVGLLAHLDAGFAASVVIVFLVFELAGYALHRLFHQVPWLWRVHAVHHNDTEVDFSTSYRHHPIEVLLATVVMVSVAALLGAPIEAVAVREIARAMLHGLSHGNVYIPAGIDRALRHIVVTPDFHRLHHASDQRFTDSNYSTVLTIYDHLFKTATSKPFDEQTTMELGLEYFRDPKDSRLDRLLLLPFLQRWKTLRTASAPASQTTA